MDRVRNPAWACYGRHIPAAQECLPRPFTTNLLEAFQRESMGDFLGADHAGHNIWPCDAVVVAIANSFPVLLVNSVLYGRVLFVERGICSTSTWIQGGTNHRSSDRH